MRKLFVCIIALLLTSFAVQAQRTEGVVSANLPGRSTVGNIPRPVYPLPLTGVIVVDITVDNYGNVLTAEPGGEGTTITDTRIWSVARTAAMSTRFNMSADAPKKQSGKISVTFSSPLLPEVDKEAFAFMGIPIDGSKYQMIMALEAKGFEKKSFHDQLTGMFNGEEVTLEVSTNHGVVDRILVIYPSCSEANDTRIKYNTLLSRLNRNAKYVCINPRDELPADERIYWNLLENSKYYDAVYFYLQPDTASKQWADEFKEEYQKHYNKPMVSGLSYEEMEEALFCLPSRLSDAVSGVVWFTMVSVHQININYINFKNRPRGEDL